MDATPEVSDEPLSEVQRAVLQLREQGMTDKDIAAAIGCGVSTVNMWANGNRATRTGDYLFGLFRLHAERCLQAKAA